jgi:hypothetical protein
LIARLDSLPTRSGALNPTLRAAVVVAALTCLAATARAADGPDPADIFPPSTLAYAELHDPGALFPQVAAAVKGSALEDGLAFIHKRRDTTTDMRDLTGKDELALVALFTSPEMLAEAKRVRGVAVGLTGFTDVGQPEYAVVVLAGESNAVGLAARAYLTMDGQVRRVGTVGTAKVPIYQYRAPSLRYDNTGRPMVEDKPQTEGPYETTLCYTPGLFVVGSSKAAVAAVVTRFLGEAKGGLSGNAAFQAVAAEHRKPGLFFYVNAAEFVAKYDAGIKARAGESEPDLYGRLKLLANPKAVKAVAGSVRFRDGGLSMTTGVTLDPAQKSPLAAFLGGSGAKAELLHPAVRPAAASFAVALPEKERAAAVVGLLDALAKGSGELGRLPGDLVREVEQKYSLRLRDGLLGKTRAVTVVYPAKQELSKGAKPFPLFVLHTDGPEVTAAWEDALPKLVGHANKAEAVPQPAVETVNGVRVLSLAGPGLPWTGPVHYAASGGRFVIGLDRKLVAAAAIADPKASVVGGEKPAVIPPPADDLVLVGTLAPGLALRGIIDGPFPGSISPTRPESGPSTLPMSGPRPVGPGVPPRANNPDDAEETKAWDAFLASFDTVQPATVTVRKRNDGLVLEVFQPKAADGGLATVINAGMGWFDKSLNRYYDPNGQFNGRPRRFR